MDAQNFSLAIVSPSLTQLHVVEWVEIEGATGSFFVGPCHAPLVALIKNKGTLTYKKADADTVSLVVSKGIFNVANNTAIVLLEQ